MSISSRCRSITHHAAGLAGWQLAGGGGGSQGLCFNGPRDEVGANCLGIPGRQRLREGHHAVLRQRAVDHDGPEDIRAGQRAAVSQVRETCRARGRRCRGRCCRSGRRPPRPVQATSAVPKAAGGFNTGAGNGTASGRLCRAAQLEHQQARIVGCVVIAGLPESGHDGNVLLAVDLVGHRPRHRAGLRVESARASCRCRPGRRRTRCSNCRQTPGRQRLRACRRCGPCARPARARLPSACTGSQASRKPSLTGWRHRACASSPAFPAKLIDSFWPIGLSSSRAATKA